MGALECHSKVPTSTEAQNGQQYQKLLRDQGKLHKLVFSGPGFSQFIFAMWVLLLWGGGIILLAMFFPTDTKKSFKIFAISAGFWLHSPDRGWVKLGGVEVALVLPGSRVLMSFHVLHCHFMQLKIGIYNIPFLTIPANVLVGFCIFS